MKRIGCLVPYTNYTVEQEIQYLFENGFMSTKDICFHFAKLQTTIRYSNDEEKYLFQLAKSTGETLKQLVSIEPDCYAFFCTSASLFDNIILDCIITVMDSLISACHFIDMRKCMLITPYTRKIGNCIAEQMEKSGITISFVQNLNIRNSKDYVYYGYHKLYSYLIDNYKKSYGDIVILCTNLPTIHLIEKIELNLNTTVITSNQSILWSILSSLQIPHNNYGAGSLLRRTLNDK